MCQRVAALAQCHCHEWKASAKLVPGLPATWVGTCVPGPNTVQRRYLWVLSATHDGCGRRRSHYGSCSLSGCGCALALTCIIASDSSLYVSPSALVTAALTSAMMLPCNTSCSTSMVPASLQHSTQPNKRLSPRAAAGHRGRHSSLATWAHRCWWCCHCHVMQCLAARGRVGSQTFLCVVVVVGNLGLHLCCTIPPPLCWAPLQTMSCQPSPGLILNVVGLIKDQDGVSSIDLHVSVIQHLC